MSGLLRRLTRRRPATADENRSPATESSDPVAAPAETPADAGGQSPAPASESRAWLSAAPGETGGTPQTSTPADEQGASQTPAETAGASQTPAETRGASQTPAETGGASQTPAETGAPSPAPAAGEQPTVALAATTDQPLPAWSVAATQPTAFAAQQAPPRDLPAGVDPGDLAAAPAASARRGKLRRRLRYLRHVRELLLRDLGGFTYEVHRSAGGTPQEPHRRLSAAKAERISKLDAEVLALESRLGEPHAEVVLREPGIGGTCPECGELHASDAHFCSRCGAPLDEKARAERAAAAPQATDSHTLAEPQPASVLWAGGPRPAPEKEEAPEPPSAVTSQWLTTDQPTTFSRDAQGDEPVKGVEPAATADEPAKADEPPTTADEPAKADEPPTTANEPQALDEPATAVDVPGPDEPEVPAADATVGADEPQALDEPATAVDVPAAAEEPVAPDEAAVADEPAPDDPAAAGEGAVANPKRVSKPRKRAPAKPRVKREPEQESFDANGRRDDEDVPPPMGDPLASPREQGP